MISEAPLPTADVANSRSIQLTGAHSNATRQWNLGPTFFAWLLPGLGHWLLGERKRGAILVGSIGGLWIAGLLIGGIGVIDRRSHPAWFAGQILTAPSLAIQYATGQPVHRQNGRSPSDPSSFQPSFGRVKEQGILFTSLAGLLNLLTMIDIAGRSGPGRSDTPLRTAAGEEQ